MKHPWIHLTGFKTASALTAAWLALPAAAQPCTAWLPSDTLPVARYGHGMVFDSGRGRFVIFGGYRDQTAYFGDTWERTSQIPGGAWVQMQTAVAPVNRVFTTMAYDPVRGKTVLFGGLYQTGLSDTWEWNGTIWSQRTPAVHPSGRFSHSMVFDTVRDTVLLFGGMAGPPSDETWEWNGDTWTQLFPNESPPPRHGTSMAYDIGRGRAVLFGGNWGGYVSDDTWEWISAQGQWVQRNPVIAPIARAEHGMAYNADRGRVVLFGGLGTGYMSDTWEWDPSFGPSGTWVWTNTVGPEQRYGHTVVYDSSRRTTILAGGYTNGEARDDVWALDCGQSQPCYANCDGSSLAPILNVSDFVCFLNSFSAGAAYANCDLSSAAPVLNVSDFICFMTRYAQGCP